MQDHFELSELSTPPNEGNRGLGERRLLAAVLRQTLDDLIENRHRADPNARRIFETASAWVFTPAPRDADDYLSFARTCDLLGLEVSYVRGLVRRLLGGERARLNRRAA